MTLPNFLVFGAGRSGTTSLHHYLGQHPEIFMPPVKEPNFFAFMGEDIVVEDHYDNWLRQNSITDLDTYEALFEGADGAQAVGEVSPWYLFHPRAPERIKALIPHARLIAILRNPADRAYAAYIARRGNGWETLADFRSAILEEKRRMCENARLGIYNYRVRGNYASQLARYFELFERDQIRIYVFEEFRCDPLTVLRDIFSFLDVDEEFRPDTETRHNPSGFIRNPVLRELWRRSALPRQWARPLLSMRVRHAAFQWLHHDTYKPPFSPDLRAELIDYYRPDIQELERLLDRDLSFWLE
jgi:hypothetical protein